MQLPWRAGGSTSPAQCVNTGAHRESVQAMAVPEAVVGDAEVQQVGQGRQACRRLDDVVIQGQVTQAAECLELVSDVLEP